MPSKRPAIAELVKAVPGVRPTLARYRRYRGRVKRAVLRAKYELHWQYLTNPRSGRLFRAQPPHLTEAQRRVARELSDRGVALIRYDELGIGGKQWERMGAVVEDFIRSPKVREGIARYLTDLPEVVRQQAANPRMGGDNYIVKLHPEGPTLGLDNPLLRLALQSPMLDVVNSYLEMWAKLIYTDVWHTIPAGGERIGSQRWHRDPEDKKMVKVYAYFANVDAGAGPLEFLVGTSLGGAYQHVWGWKPRDDERYPLEGELERRLPNAERVVCVGSPGTVVFCDTSGFHRGGIATSSARIVATWTFVTPASLGVTSRRRFSLTRAIEEPALTDAAKFAIT